MLLVFASTAAGSTPPMPRRNRQSWCCVPTTANTHGKVQNTTPAAVASPLGFSTGHWEGDTLVVRTTNVVGGQFGRGIAMGDDAEFLERISASDDGSRLNYTITVTDPSAFLEPAEITHHWIYLPGSTVPTYGCLEG